jgi:uncharacterized protein YjdB
MQTHIIDFNYSIHTIQRVSHRLKLVEEPIVNTNRSKLDVYIIRTNSGKEADGGNEYLKLTVNGEVVFDKTYGTKAVPANSTQEVFIKTFYVNHNSDGAGPLNVSATYKCDYIEGWGMDIFWWTIATAEFTGNFTPIDMSYPSISDVVVKSNRYGIDSSASFKVSHSIYSITSVQFTLYGLTKEQAQYRYGKVTEADTSNYSKVSEDNYKLILTKSNDLSESNYIFFDLDDTVGGKHPLDSGKRYVYDITVTALNGKSRKISGDFYVPQKVTGIICESEINLLPGDTTELLYEVYPNNAEEKGVIFKSSDPTIAAVNEEGKITAVSEGTCVITVTTIDAGPPDAESGFWAACYIYVIDKAQFPKLETIQYLSTREITKIDFAINFLSEKLAEKGYSVPQLIQITNKGRSHPVREIKKMLDDINTNCINLKNVSVSIYDTENLLSQTNLIKENTESNWYAIVNDWIRFLNELNSRI